jgi:hypothetical protein
MKKRLSPSKQAFLKWLHDQMFPPGPAAKWGAYHDARAKLESKERIMAAIVAGGIFAIEAAAAVLLHESLLPATLSLCLNVVFLVFLLHRYVTKTLPLDLRFLQYMWRVDSKLHDGLGGYND